MIEKETVTRHLGLITLLSLGIILFSLSFPGYFNENGIALLAFVALIPVYHSIGKMNYRESIVYGFFYGTGNYLLFNYWLKGFDPISFSVAPTILGSYHIILFLGIKYIFNNFKKLQYIPLTLIWLAYEVFKGENKIGYTYGTIAHTMYRTNYFTGIADITGTYVLSLIIIFPGILIVSSSYSKIKLWSKSLLPPIIIYFFILISSIIYTNINKIDYSHSPTLRVSLIQHNLDCWLKGSNQLYKEALDNLLRLSSEAERLNPDLVVWAESAFVPAIEWHKKYKKNYFRLNLVKRLEDFTAQSNADYLIGTNETIGEFKENQIQYNTVYHYIKDRSVNKYSKQILVPFTEQFPYPELFPTLYQYTIDQGANHYLPGKEQTLFTIKDVKTTQLICYEDTFSRLARNGVKNGANLIINMTNDAWSTEPACTKQHLTAAIFRSIENRRSLVRVGTGGYTCVIDPNGKILASIPILTQNQLTYDVPIIRGKNSFYTKNGPIIKQTLLYLFLIIIGYSFAKSIHRVLLLKKR